MNKNFQNIHSIHSTKFAICGHVFSTCGFIRLLINKSSHFSYHHIQQYLKAHDYGNVEEVEKIYDIIKR